jgi:hypothetical protein
MEREDCDKVIHQWLVPTQCFEVKVNPGTSAGLKYKMQGLKTKAEASQVAAADAYHDILGMVGGDRKLHVGICSMAGRAKKVENESKLNDSRSTGKAEGRLIIVTPLDRHIRGAIAQTPYQKLTRSFNKSLGGTLLGAGPFGGDWEEILTLFQGKFIDEKVIPGDGPIKQVFYCLDFSKFDKRLKRDLLREVLINKISRRFTRMAGSRTYWKNEVHNAIFTTVADPTGHIYQKMNGITSGDPWTSILGSECNEIMLTDIFSMIDDVCLVRPYTFGDDSVVCVMYREENEWRMPTLAEISQRGRDRWGAVIHPDKSRVCLSLLTHPNVLTDDESGLGVNFLSMYFAPEYEMERIVPTRSLESVQRILMTPEWNEEDDWKHELTRVVSLYLSSYFNRDAEAHLRKYHNHLLAKNGVEWGLELTRDDARFFRRSGADRDVSKFFSQYGLPSGVEVHSLYFPSMSGRAPKKKFKRSRVYRGTDGRPSYELHYNVSDGPLILSGGIGGTLGPTDLYRLPHGI